MCEYEQAIEDLRRFFKSHEHPNPNGKVNEIREALLLTIQFNDTSGEFSIYPHELLAVQLFVTKFGCHLTYRFVDNHRVYSIVPNWKCEAM